MSKVTCILIIFFNVNLLYSQTDTFPVYNNFKNISVRFHKGFIIPHSESIKSISYSKPWIIEGDFSWHYNTKKAWSYCSCFPRVGISGMYINFDNPGILGQGFTLSSYVEPYFSVHRKFNTSFRFAAGVAYLNNVYNPETNPLNLFYSTNFSYILTAAFTFNYRISNFLNLSLTANYNHISNGGNKLPNKGINFPTVSVGFDYALKPVSFNSSFSTIQDTTKRKSEIRIGILGAAKKPFPGENKRYLLYGFVANYSYLIGKISAISGGMEFVNDQSLLESLRRDSLSSIDHKRIGMLAGHELRIGRFRFSQELGVYIYTPAKAKDPVYQRWGLEFLATKWLSVGLNIKAHRHVADFMDVRIRYIPWLKKK